MNFQVKAFKRAQTRQTHHKSQTELKTNQHLLTGRWLWPNVLACRLCGC